MQCLYISFTSLQGQTNKKVDKHRFIHQRSDLYFGVHGSKYGVFPHHFLRTRIVFLKPFLKGKILRSSERGVNSILTTILRF